MCVCFLSTCFCRCCSQHHLKKLEGRRLDFDYKKKRQGKIPEEEIRQAVEKFDESKELAERSMFNFLENDVRDAKTWVTGRVSHVRRYRFLASSDVEGRLIRVPFSSTTSPSDSQH